MKALSISSLLCFYLCSCSSYVSYLHKKFDRYDRKQQERQYPEGLGGFYGRRRPQQKRPSAPHSLNTTKIISTHTTSRLDPSVRRQYRSLGPEKKRYKVKDLNDTKHTGGLWVNHWDQSKVDYLFSQNNRKKNGDIVLIHVYPKLKNEITQELKRAFPIPSPKKSGTPSPAASPTPEAQAQEETISDNLQGPGRVQDKISSIVIDEINRDHLLLKGRKDLLYHNRKRTIELQALVARRNIDDNDIIKSNDILDFSVQVVKK